jgi:hypothetical protein
MPDKVVEPIEARAPDAAKARALYDYIYGNFTRNPLIQDDVLMGTVSAAATLDLRVWDGYLHTQSVQTLDPGFGGSVALRLLCDSADKFGVWLHLIATPLGMDKQFIKKARKLVEWYEHFGFKRKDSRMVRGAAMVRAPRGRDPFMYHRHRRRSFTVKSFPEVSRMAAIYRCRPESHIT